MKKRREAHRLQQKYGWPKTFLPATAKNHKKRTMEIVEILGDTMPPTAAVQTTDEEILKTIKRKNAPMDQMEEMAALTAEKGGQSEAEIILCLQGETREKHFRSVFNMLDAGMSYIRLYQFMMLPGTEAASRKEREEYGFKTKFRVLPRCFGNYTFRGTTFPVAEVEEIVVANKTLPFEAYQACRSLHLTVEVFNNDSLFVDLIRFLNFNGVKRSEFVSTIHERITGGDGVLMGLLLLEVMAAYGTSLHELVENLLRDFGPVEYTRHDLRLAHPVEKKDLVRRLQRRAPDKIGHLSVKDLQTTDGVKYLLENDSWLLIRPSGTEPLLRVYAEGRNEADVEALLDYGREVAQSA